MLAMTIGDVTDTRGDGCNLLARVEFLGSDHHLGFVRVRDRKGIQTAFSDCDDEICEDIGRLYDYRFQTVNVPGFPGHFVAYMHPAGE